MTQRWFHPIQYRAEALVARAALVLLRRLGPVRGSNLACAVARTIGPLLPVSRVADINLRHAMPELDAAARRRVIRGVWENLGRTVAELPHVATLGPTAQGPGWEVEGGEILHRCRDAGGTMILFSGHIGCWELLPALLGQNGMPMASFYRAAGNPEVDALINAMRRDAVGTDVPFFNKSAKGAREAMLYLAQGGRVGMLVDQKMNEGIEARLFGQPVMTTTSPAAFALRFQCPMVPGHTIRIGPCRFRIVVEPPLPLPDSGDHHADILALTQTMNDCLERWIRAWPEGWLWLHRRFPMEVYGR
jgi:KDO2-lipid IV(A) lauroyltransferase